MAVVELTKENFDQTVKGNPIVLVEFYSPYCIHCQSFDPIYIRVSDKYPDVVFGMVNVLNQEDLTNEHSIMGTPTVEAYKQDTLVFRQAGELPEQTLETLVEKVKELDLAKIKTES